MAARKQRIFLDENWRTKIKATQIIHNLQEHVEGRLDMTNTQIKAADILLKKCLPDLSQVQADHTSSDGSMATLDVSKLSTDVIKAILKVRDETK